MFFAASILFSIGGLIAATHTDMKERIVPNKLNFTIAGIGLALHAIHSFTAGSLLPIIYSFWGLILGFLFGWVLWKGGVFAGGDVKLFMGLGALNPFTPALLKAHPFVSSQFSVFPATLFIYSAIAFLPYGLSVALYRLAKNKKFQKKLLQEIKKRLKTATELAFFGAGAYSITTFFGITPWAVLAAIILWSLIKKHRVVVSAIIFLAGAIAFPVETGKGLVAILVVSGGGYTLIKILFSLRLLLSKKISVSELEEGMIPAKTLIWKGDKVKEAESIGIRQIIKYAKKHKISELLAPKNEIVSARKARGLNEEELEKMKSLAKKGKIPKHIFVKDTLPFVPTILLGYLFCLIFGDAWLIILGAVA